MLTLELSPYLMEIPDDAYYMYGYATQVKFWLAIPHSSQEYSKLIGWYYEVMRRQIYTLTCPFDLFQLSDRTDWC